jgi:intracellular sulfur oxidation DsrE/DsrF family protein
MKKGIFHRSASWCWLTVTLWFFSTGSTILLAQSPAAQAGPVIQDFGAVYAVPDLDFLTDTQRIYRVVFDIHSSPEDPAVLNPAINTLARFLNMHTQAGVPPENLRVVGVIHNLASKDALNSAAYRERYGVGNPNEPLLEALAAAGAELYICGQSVYARGLERERLAAPVEVGLSALTIILTLEAEGYQLIKF